MLSTRAFAPIANAWSSLAVHPIQSTRQQRTILQVTPPGTGRAMDFYRIPVPKPFQSDPLRVWSTIHAPPTPPEPVSDPASEPVKKNYALLAEGEGTDHLHRTWRVSIRGSRPEENGTGATTE